MSSTRYSHAPCPNPGTTQPASGSDLLKSSAIPPPPDATPRLASSPSFSLSLLTPNPSVASNVSRAPALSSLPSNSPQSQKVNTKTSRADSLALAKLAEQAERWDGARELSFPPAAPGS